MSRHELDPDQELRVLLRGLIAQGLPDRRVPVQPNPRERSWSVVDGPSTVPQARVKSARQEVAQLLGPVPEKVVRRHWTSGGWGRKKRFNSLLLGRPMMAASSLEFDVCRDLELDTTNRWFIEQPLTLRYNFGGQWRDSTPDFLVLGPKDPECIEVKYEAQACSPDAERKWAAIGQGYRTIGIAFRVLTELHVRREPRFTNVKTIFALRHLPVDPERALSVRNLLSGRQGMLAGELSAHCGVSIEQLWSLVRRLHIAVDVAVGELGPMTWVTARR